MKVRANLFSSYRRLLCVLVLSCSFRKFFQCFDKKVNYMENRCGYDVTEWYWTALQFNVRFLIPHSSCLKFFFTVNAVLSAIEGTQLLYSLQPHPALNPIMHLLPPNIMVSGHELIPGVLPPTDSTGKITHDAIAYKSLLIQVMILRFLSSPQSGLRDDIRQNHQGGKKNQMRSVTAWLKQKNLCSHGDSSWYLGT